MATAAAVLGSILSLTCDSNRTTESASMAMAMRSARECGHLTDRQMIDITTRRHVTREASLTHSHPCAHEHT